ncbi:hypothetical protein HY439_01780 [Candidatus Microgenomates bacterium]|nr:hypothetical protein [Candidatus Microgenomates bacterium]
MVRNTAESAIAVEVAGDKRRWRDQMNPVERDFALFLKTERPNLKLTYEPTAFEYTNGDGKLEGTRPDFYILNTLTGRGIYVEITTALRGNKGEDRKAKQKRVMRAQFPKQRHVVLYGENLENVQRVHKCFKSLTVHEGNGNGYKGRR